jgi:hypothetical protein
MLGGIGFLFLFLLFLAGRAAMGPAPWLMTLIFNLFVVISPVLAVVAFLYPFVIYPYFAIREIIIGKDGVILKRKIKPITIQKVTDFEIRKAPIGGRVTGITINGLAPDGSKVRKILMKQGDVGKKWEEFKADLQKIKSK